MWAERSWVWSPSLNPSHRCYEGRRLERSRKDSLMVRFPIPDFCLKSLSFLELKLIFFKYLVEIDLPFSGVKGSPRLKNSGALRAAKSLMHLLSCLWTFLERAPFCNCRLVLTRGKRKFRKLLIPLNMEFPDKGVHSWQVCRNMIPHVFRHDFRFFWFHDLRPRRIRSVGHVVTTIIVGFEKGISRSKLILWVEVLIKLVREINFPFYDLRAHLLDSLHFHCRLLLDELVSFDLLSFFEWSVSYHWVPKFRLCNLSFYTFLSSSSAFCVNGLFLLLL